MNDNLKPCPFCGGSLLFYQIFSNGRNVWKVMCGKSVDCCAILNEFDTKEQAIDAWNNRSAAPDTINSQLVELVTDFVKTSTCITCRERKKSARNILKQLNS